MAASELHAAFVTLQLLRNAVLDFACKHYGVALQFFPNSIAALIVASTANTAQRCGRLGSAIMHLPESMDTTSAVAYLKQSGVTDEDAASDRVVSSLVVSSAPCQSAAHSMIAILTSACRGERARAAEATKAWRMQFISCTSCGWLDRVPP